MIGGYIVQTPSFEKKKYKRVSRRHTRTSSHRRRRHRTSSSGNRRRSRRRIKKALQKGGGDCVSYGFKGLSDGLGLAQNSSN